MGAKFGPDLDDRHVVVELVLFDQDVHTRAGHALGGRRQHEESVRINLLPGSLIGPAGPGVDHQLAIQISRHLQTQLGRIPHQLFERRANFVASICGCSCRGIRECRAGGGPDVRHGCRRPSEGEALHELAPVQFSLLEVPKQTCADVCHAPSPLRENDSNGIVRYLGAAGDWYEGPKLLCRCGWRRFYKSECAHCMPSASRLSTMGTHDFHAIAHERPCAALRSAIQASANISNPADISSEVSCPHLVWLTNSTFQAYGRARSAQSSGQPRHYSFGNSPLRRMRRTRTRLTRCASKKSAAI